MVVFGVLGGIPQPVCVLNGEYGDRDDLEFLKLTTEGCVFGFDHIEADGDDVCDGADHGGVMDADTRPTAGIDIEQPMGLLTAVAVPNPPLRVTVSQTHAAKSSY